MNAFIKLGVIEPLAQALYQQGIRFPTVIQQASIPAIFKGKDIIGRSETGTGKTLAYLLPGTACGCKKRRYAGFDYDTDP